jgi:hypothetical protein
MLLVFLFVGGTTGCECPVDYPTCVRTTGLDGGWWCHDPVGDEWDYYSDNCGAQYGASCTANYTGPFEPVAPPPPSPPPGCECPLHYPTCVLAGDHAGRCQGLPGDDEWHTFSTECGAAVPLASRCAFDYAGGFPPPPPPSPAPPLGCACSLHYPICVHSGDNAGWCQGLPGDDQWHVVSWECGGGLDAPRCAFDYPGAYPPPPPPSPAPPLGCVCPEHYPTCVLSGRNAGWCEGVDDKWNTLSTACGARGGSDCGFDHVAPPAPPPSLPGMHMTEPVCTLDYEWRGCAAKCDFGFVSEKYGIDVELTLHIDVRSATEGELLLEFDDGTEIVSFEITDGEYRDSLSIPLPVPAVELSIDLGVTVGQTVTAVKIENAMDMDVAVSVTVGGIPMASFPLGGESFTYSCWNVPFLVGAPLGVAAVVGLVGVAEKMRRKKRGAAQALLEFESARAPSRSVKGAGGATELAETKVDMAGRV